LHKIRLSILLSSSTGNELPVSVDCRPGVQRKPWKGKTEMRCAKCGHGLKRLPRIGFLQKKVYPRFGYYPWECPFCRDQVMLKKQHEHKKQGVRKSAAE
jgi:DNA-directed RNA polymerase subunit RPC12/RpoP